jgi:radical SAM superfamily enzyme YgiQ (UPF0313 family)
MKINLVSIEDGINNTGFRKLSAYIHKIYPDTGIFYVTTGNSRTFRHLLLMKSGTPLQDDDIAAIADTLAGADVVGVSSMTPYADIAVRVIAAIRRRNPKVFIVWGGAHAIIEPEDAIRHADAACTGEGEFAFARLLDALREGRPYADTPGFWINTPDGIKKNLNLPLMTMAEMDALPLLTYQDGECLYKPGRGFAPIAPADFIDFNGLFYKTVWSIGCPLKCSYCGNSKFIDYDRNYRKIRHSSPATIMAEVKKALARQPHIATVEFDDDSFMALPMRVLEEFCQLYTRDIGLPLVITGLIPNYVRDDKMRLLVAAGMNRVRMGVQSGSQAILDFYERPTPVARIREACRVLNTYRDFMIPPSFDIILDNPIETAADNRATLDLLHEMPRPFTLNVFSLRIIPNTRLAASLEERGIEIDDIRQGYVRPRPTASNIMVHALATAPLPARLFRRWRDGAEPSRTPQPLYPALMMAVRFVYLCKRASDHLRVLDLTVLSGAPIRLLWRLGLLRLWRPFFIARYASAARARRVLAMAPAAIPAAAPAAVLVETAERGPRRSAP